MCGRLVAGSFNFVGQWVWIKRQFRHKYRPTARLPNNLTKSGSCMITGRWFWLNSDENSARCVLLLCLGMMVTKKRIVWYTLYFPSFGITMDDIWPTRINYRIILGRSKPRGPLGTNGVSPTEHIPIERNGAIAGGCLLRTNSVNLCHIMVIRWFKHQNMTNYGHIAEFP